MALCHSAAHRHKSFERWLQTQNQIVGGFETAKGEDPSECAMRLDDLIRLLSLDSISTLKDKQDLWQSSGSIWQAQKLYVVAISRTPLAKGWWDLSTLKPSKRTQKFNTPLHHQPTCKYMLLIPGESKVGVSEISKSTTRSPTSAHCELVKHQSHARLPSHTIIHHYFTASTVLIEATMKSTSLNLIALYAVARSAYVRHDRHHITP